MKAFAITALFILGLFLLEPGTAHGTLVIMVPSNAGLVVAADSRTSAAGLHCDSAFKILLPTKSKRAVATVTGTGIILGAPSQPVPIVQICDHIRTGTRILDIEKVVRSYLDETDTFNIESIINSCIESVRDFGVKYANVLQQYRGQGMFNVVLASYNPVSRTANAQGFVIGINYQSEPFLVRKFEMTGSSENRQDFWSFGETDYFNRHVVAGVGRQFLSAETIRFYTEPRPIRDMTLNDATALAKDVLQATVRTTSIIAPPSGIGGPIDVVLIGTDERPHQIQWKSQ